MWKVLRDLKPIGKNQENKQQGFKFRGIDDVMDALNPVLGEHGVFFLPEVLERRDSHRETAKGGDMWVVSLRVKYTFYGLLGDSVVAIVEGEGTDSGDKATQKALTAAEKYCLFQAFAISTKELAESDSDHITPQETYAPRRQEPQERPQPTSQFASEKERTQFIAAARKRGVVIEPPYLNLFTTDDLNALWERIKTGEFEGEILGTAKSAQDAQGVPSGLSPLALLPEDLAVVVKEKRGVFAAGWVQEFLQRKGHALPTPEDLIEIERECR
ncbi:MAG TPA: ERF family protein [Geobacteraceae bacterium]|nr:ERF family protein [Geobacteraceae bacterium]